MINRGTVHRVSAPGLRYMRRRRIGTADRNGDPLDGIVNLFDVAIVLAVGFLVAALAGAGMSDLLTSKNLTIVTNPGTARMQVIVKQGQHLSRLSLANGAPVGGAGTLLGAFYRLNGGTVVYVPAGSMPPGGASQTPAAAATAGAPSPSASPSPSSSAYPAAPSPSARASASSSPAPGAAPSPGQ